MSLKNTMVDVADIKTINSYACDFLNTDKLPKKIHALLQTVFTKREAKFRKHIMVTEKGVHKEKHLLKQGYNAIVGNCLILLTLIESSETKQLFEYYFSTLHTPESRHFDAFFDNSDGKSPAYFFCGIDKNNIDKVNSRLMDVNFDLFTQKLPLPVNDKGYILHLLAQDIPWQQYLENYQQAESYFYKEDMFKAKEILLELDKKTLIKLIPVQLLLAKVNTDIEEAEEASLLISDLLK